MRRHLNDVRGAARLAVDGVTRVTDLVEAMHGSIAAGPRRYAGPLAQRPAALVYGSIRAVARAVGAGVDLALGAVPPASVAAAPSPGRDALVAALNGVLGDHLARTANPLAQPMQLWHGDQPLVPERAALAALLPAAGPKLLVLVHGLCMNDRRWAREGHDHGAALARDLGYSVVRLRYNSGLHVSANGRELAALLESLVAAWPVPVAELAVIGHSMGGLVARSAHHYGCRAGHGWPARLRDLVFLGTPHHGVPLERIGHWLDGLWLLTPYTAPLAALGRARSAGITDLGHGCLLEEDWRGHSRAARATDRRHPLPLPAGVRCHAVAASLGSGAVSDRLVGDGLVAVPSALGQHREPRRRLAFAPGHAWVARGVSHLDLLSSPAVYQQVRAWLAA